MKGVPIETQTVRSTWSTSSRSKSTWPPPCSTAPASTLIVSLPAKSPRSEEARRSEIIALGARHRGRHDELLREFSAGQGLRFDILMDIGGFRDMHRHRRCIQILQSFTNAHGFEVPDVLAEAGLLRAI